MERRFKTLDYWLISVAFVMVILISVLLTTYFIHKNTLVIEKTIIEKYTEYVYVDEPPKTQEIVEVVVEKPVYIDRPVEKIVAVEKPIIKVVDNFTNLQDFDNLENLTAWCNINCCQTIVLNDGKVDFIKPSELGCVFQATTLQKVAEKNGYRLSLLPTLDGYVCNVKVCDVKGLHMICMANVDGYFYAIEPVTGQITYIDKDGIRYR